MKSQITFLKGALSQFKDTGSICPTSRFAAEAMLADLNDQDLRILEVGPGTGSITKYILQRLAKNKTLQICEINSMFMDYLKTELAKNPDFTKHQEQVDFFLGPIQQLQSSQPFDYIVCALPFLNFDSSTLNEILNKLVQLSHSGTRMCFYQYLGLKDLGTLLGSQKNKSRVLEVSKEMEKFLSKRKLSRETVWLNVSPIKVYTIAMDPKLSS